MVRAVVPAAAAPQSQVPFYPPPVIMAPQDGEGSAASTTARSEQPDAEKGGHFDRAGACEVTTAGNFRCKT